MASLSETAKPMIKLFKRLASSALCPSVGWFCALVFLNLTATTLAKPFTPRDDNQALERLPAKSTAAEARALRRYKAELANDPENLQASLRLAKNYIEKSRTESDPRYLGFAQATLNPWWNLPLPPVDVLVLRATIRQSNHDFEAALDDLALALKADPANAQAWLTRAIILEVRGEYEEAKRACRPLLRLTSELVAATCATSIASLHGEAPHSYELLRGICAKNPGASSSERLWSLTVLAEIAARLGRFSEAEDHFKQALALGERDGYLLGTYADFLLDQARPKEVISLLANESRVDGLLLRLALAENLLTPTPPGLKQHTAALRDRFSASRQRGDTVHRREEARFTLHLLHQPREALRLAKENWGVQREPADARVFLEAALAAKDFAAAQLIVDWLEKNRLQDVQLAKLVQEAKGLPFLRDLPR